MTWQDMKYGVEIEFTGITRKQAADALSAAWGTRTEHVGGTYDTYQAIDQQGRVWKLMSDSSIRAQRKTPNGSFVMAGRDFQCEIVSPVLTHANMSFLQEVVRILRRAGGRSNDSCGFHVHLSAPQEFNCKQLINLINMVHSKQNLIYEALGVINSRIGYCQKLPDRLTDTIRRKKPRNIEALADIYYNELGGSRTGHYSSARYYCLNLHNLFSGRLPTVEFRCANGSLRHAGQIRAIIECYSLLVAYSFNAKSCSPKVTVPHGSVKYTFRVFLLHLGCIGDELATCRKHMLKNLDGDIARLHEQNSA